MKRPSFQFYPGDYMKDPALRACSLTARGLWMDCICLMHEGPEYGYLTLDHKPLDKVILARIIGTTLSEVDGCLNELKQHGVYAVDDRGIITSKRMIRDEYLRNVRAEGGKHGGNPALLAKKTQTMVVNKVGNKVSPPGNLKPTPSSSSSSSTSVIDTGVETPKVNQRFVKPTLEELKGAMA